MFWQQKIPREYKRHSSNENSIEGMENKVEISQKLMQTEKEIENRRYNSVIRSPKSLPNSWGT